MWDLRAIDLTGSTYFILEYIKMTLDKEQNVVDFLEMVRENQAVNCG